MKYLLGVSVVLAFVGVSGCSDPAGGNTDTGGGIDAAVHPDANTRDGGGDGAADTGAHDTGVSLDARTADAPALPDAGGTFDANCDLDACFMTHDTGSMPPDAGVDAASTPDVGVDAGHDAGSDGGIDAGRDAGSDAGRDGGRDASADANVGGDGGCLAIFGEMGRNCAAGMPACAAGFTCQPEDGIILNHYCQIRCDSPSFVCPCGTSCFDHADAHNTWRQCDQL